MPCCKSSVGAASMHSSLSRKGDPGAAGLQCTLCAAQVMQFKPTSKFWKVIKRQDFMDYISPKYFSCVCPCLEKDTVRSQYFVSRINVIENNFLQASTLRQAAERCTFSISATLRSSP